MMKYAALKGLAQHHGKSQLRRSENNDGPIPQPFLSGWKTVWELVRTDSTRQKLQFNGY